MIPQSMYSILFLLVSPIDYLPKLFPCRIIEVSKYPFRELSMAETSIIQLPGRQSASSHARRFVALQSIKLNDPETR